MACDRGEPLLCDLSDKHWDKNALMCCRVCDALPLTPAVVQIHKQQSIHSIKKSHPSHSVGFAGDLFSLWPDFSLGINDGEMDLDEAIILSGSQNEVFAAVEWTEEHLSLSVQLYEAFSDSILSPGLSESSPSLTLR